MPRGGRLPDGAEGPVREPSGPAHDVLRSALWLEPGTIVVDVRDAVVCLSGAVDNHSLIDIVVRLCRAVDGVESVTHTLTFDFDDSRIRPGPAHFARRSPGR
ncbi:BON domain-containing protein [Embleya sp. NPDC020630]|uniref:BON domain-containing protein n=1 Tax=Embleya sp. NPDC020630 TaxID=3363979 RepID=UPI0037BE177D